MRHHRTTTSSSTRRVAIGAPLALAGALGLTACADAEETPNPEEGSTAEEVAEAGPAGPPRLLGRDITVSGRAADVLGDGALLLEGTELAPDDVLVLAGDGLFDTSVSVDDQIVESETILRVHGTVHVLQIPDLSEDLGVEWDEADLEEYEGQTVLVAEDVETFTDDPLTLGGTVANVFEGAAGFRLSIAGWNVVVLDAALADVEEGQYVEVTGVVEELDIAELEEKYGVDLEDRLYEDYVGDHVLVAQEVTATEPAGASA
ncbi:hypothetical protein [Actinotalea sp. Marseille-Q4924]|uniref:hypothetical protein n=1 Tax=Actinotalea sp. Marseille-Q4924 TaxID=2866571 RepID=UPI001CE45E30|nr:hypothetical protein [Actinotalea sp. Marseille-Q4924]